MENNPISESEFNFENQEFNNSFQKIDLFFNGYKNLCRKYKFFIAGGDIFPVEDDQELERSFQELSKNIFTFW
jgi:hypothetical protein